MISLTSIVDSWIWYLTCFIALILFTFSGLVMVITIWEHRKTALKIISAMNLFLISVVVMILMDCARYMMPGEYRVYSELQKIYFEMPVDLIFILEMFSGLVLLIVFLESIRYRGKNLTMDSIQRSVDALPEGICISSMEGEVLLSNITFSTLCRSLTGKVLSDTHQIWSYAREHGKEQGGSWLITSKTGEVWLFEKEKLEVDGKDYDQITATNVTGSYRIIEELEEKNERLQDIRRRMKEVSDLSGDMFIAQEEADARAALHNQLGQVLLMGRHYINHKEVTDPKMVYVATMQMNRFLLGEAKDPYEGREDELQTAISMANSIGVKIDIQGEEPSDADIRRILSQVITECAANTVKHAEGDLVKIDIDREEDIAVITVTNNGKPPKAEIRESGGLLSIRRNVEALDGTMLMESKPRFVLMLRLKNQKNGTNG